MARRVDTDCLQTIISKEIFNLWQNKMKLSPQFSKIDHLILRGMFCCKNIHAKEQDFIEA
ncbi:hypothetical protein LMB63_04505 [Limosilactobacillus reuteri]|uniref:Uncharacterized protein n=2 Tax=Limosilactobacillus reuteri TaxID=1598 RepID=A0ABD6XDE1_LIMRT|nr:hypothetical protein [Limosilactobacillus sp. DJ3M12]MCC4510565.1 hypothetical protein [Limosilactobacillus reuteri]PEG94513.1 hypothetical protein CP361_05960 [Lactobacillus sp. UMNPBX10]MQB61520.1 hypothetical protein [Limosilactobacillus reuteri]PTM27793.1 hypothetical protein DA797_02810 [Limosilactobacillus reuteri]PTM29723.1 hypothetical protein DA796_04535 [Limosilactobacillus reuteri]